MEGIEEKINQLRNKLYKLKEEKKNTKTKENQEILNRKIDCVLKQLKIKERLLFGEVKTKEPTLEDDKYNCNF